MNMSWKDRALLLLPALLVFPLVFPKVNQSYQINIELNGKSSTNVPADRVTLYLEISSKGPKQDKVANEVRQTTDEVLELLRPLTQPPSQRTSTSDSGSDATPSFAGFLAPIATLSVDTFSSNSVARESLFGDSTTYSSKVKVRAEFRCLPPSKPSSDQTVVPGAGFYHLPLVLPLLTKHPNMEIKQLKWFLEKEHLASVQSEVRTNATQQALTKLSDYTGPLRLRFPTARCVRMYEEDGHRVQLFEASVHPELESDVISERVPFPRSGYEYGYQIEEQDGGVFDLEPKSIQIQSEVNMDWRITSGLIWAILGYLL